jgi:hypothetical protein
MKINNISNFPVKKDEYGGRYVEVPISFMLEVYLRDDEDDEEQSELLPNEVDANVVSDAIDNLERTELGELVLNNIEMT